MSDHHLSTHIFGDEDGGAHSSRAELRRRRRGPNRRPVGCLVTLVALLAVAAAAFFSLGQIRPMVSGLLGGAPDYSASDVATTTKNVTISQGQGSSDIGAMLEKAGIVMSSGAFVSAAKANPEWTRMQPGTYALHEHSPAEDVVKVLVDPKNRITTLVTVREGLRKWEVYQLLADKTKHSVAEYEAAEKDTAAIGLPAQAKGDIEGWLFPSSYEFSTTTTPTQQLQAMIAKAEETMAGLGVSPEKMQRTLVIASIVEAEGKLDVDRPKIARVVENRLAKPMRLQLDSTVVYPVKKRVLATTDADRRLVNGYNTYTHEGLPKGPISNPGKASLEAAVHPADGTWLYFVAVNPVSGETKFATEWAEHERNVAEWQAFCKSHQGSC